MCDLGRMALVALMALPGLPLPLLLVLLLCSSLCAPPFQAARSAMVAQLLTGDRFVAGISLQNLVSQAAQVAGYAVGGLISAVDPHIALVINAVTFGASGLLLWRGVGPRPATAAVQRASLLKETGDGLRLVFGHRVMRSVAFGVFSMVGVLIVPEALGVGWSAELGGGALTAGLIMAAIQVGNVIGIVAMRLTPPERRLRLIKPFLLGAPLFLVPALVGPPTAVVFVLAVSAGIMNTVNLPLNGLFVSVLPAGFRARAFGVMQSGVQITNAIAILVAGALAEEFPVSTVVGAWAVGGALLMALAVATWPRRAVVDAERARVEASAAESASGSVPEPRPR